MVNKSKLDNRKHQIKSYEISFDETSERFVFEIFDKDAMFPLLIKVQSANPRELVLTQNQKLHLI